MEIHRTRRHGLQPPDVGRTSRQAVEVEDDGVSLSGRGQGRSGHNVGASTSSGGGEVRGVDEQGRASPCPVIVPRRERSSPMAPGGIETTAGPPGRLEALLQVACRPAHDRRVRHPVEQPGQRRRRAAIDTAAAPDAAPPASYRPEPASRVTGGSVSVSMQPPPALRRGSRHPEYGAQRPMKSANCNLLGTAIGCFR